MAMEEEQQVKASTSGTGCKTIIPPKTKSNLLIGESSKGVSSAAETCVKQELVKQQVGFPRTSGTGCNVRNPPKTKSNLSRGEPSTKRRKGAARGVSSAAEASVKQEIVKQQVLLTKMTTKQYLDSLVVPIVRKALSAANKERPKDPIDFLIAFMIKEKEEQKQRLSKAAAMIEEDP